MSISDEGFLMFADGPRFSDGGDDYSDPFSPFDFPEPTDEIDDDAVYEITPKGLACLEESELEQYTDEIEALEEKWANTYAESRTQRQATVQRWYDERAAAREQVVEYSEIIGALMNQFELVGQKLRDEHPVEAALLVEEILQFVERVDDAE